MTTAIFEAVARKFISSSDPEVLALKGSWEVGKTHAWHKFIEANGEHTHLPHYSYVSLFGIGSITELRLAIVSATASLRTIGTKVTLQALNEHWFNYSKPSLKPPSSCRLNMIR